MNLFDFLKNSSIKDAKKERVLIVVFVMVIFAGVLKTYFDETRVAVNTFSMPVNKKVIVVDAGHGGWDPGMIGVAGTNEKDINLLIAEKLQSYLELGGAIALVTRDGDEATGDTKREDLGSRREIANTSNADILVSIHQNSYPQQSVRGAQVFYYEGSEKSKLLAESIQEQVMNYLDRDNKRIAKPNSNYYLLKRTSIPSVIVECGFLTNYDEERLLTMDEYQEKVAWTIYMGIIQYFASENETAE